MKIKTKEIEITIDDGLIVITMFILFLISMVIFQ